MQCRAVDAALVVAFSPGVFITLVAPLAASQLFPGLHLTLVSFGSELAGW